MEMVSLESEYKRMTTEIKELRELLGEVWKFTDYLKSTLRGVVAIDEIDWESMKSRVQKKLEE